MTFKSWSAHERLSQIMLYMLTMLLAVLAVHGLSFTFDLSRELENFQVGAIIVAKCTFRCYITIILPGEYNDRKVNLSCRKSFPPHFLHFQVIIIDLLCHSTQFINRHSLTITDAFTKAPTDWHRRQKMQGKESFPRAGSCVIA